MKLIANLSMMFTEYPLAERIPAAAKAGFDGVEIQFPPEEEASSLGEVSQTSSMPVALINVPRGPGDSVGLAALPRSVAAYRDAVAVCAKNAQAIGARKINILSGRPPADANPEDCLSTLVENVRYTADFMEEIGVRVMVEPVNRQDVPGFFLSGLHSGLDLLDRVDHPNVALQFDFYHMAITEPDLVTAIQVAGEHIGHVQFADNPGRHEPGTGTVDFRSAFNALRKTGYDGEISAEYNPAGHTEQGLGWMNDIRSIIG